MLAVILGAFHGAEARGAEPLTVQVRVAPGPYYVGQAIDAEVDVVAGDERRPEVALPKVDGADPAFLGTDVATIDADRNLFRFRFRYRLIARRAGTLSIAPVRARLGARRGASRALAVAVKAPPASGRPAGFLGGVGAFTVEASATPTAVRPGETIEYRITIRGPAAWGVTTAPDLSRLARAPLGLVVARRPDVAVADPPSHTFISMLRPTRAGAAVLPPVPVAAFDPKAARYVTRAAPGVPVRVADVARFDPEALRNPPTVRSSSWSVTGWRAVGFVVIAAVLGVGGAVVVRRAWRRRDVIGPAARRARDEARAALERAGDDAGRGRAITEGLIAYLALTTGRPRGALTPEEAERGVAEATGSVDLARRAFHVVASSDRARFDEESPRTADLENLGRTFLDDLAAAARLARPDNRPPSTDFPFQDDAEPPSRSAP